MAFTKGSNVPRCLHAHIVGNSASSNSYMSIYRYKTYIENSPTVCTKTIGLSIDIYALNEVVCFR